MFIVAAASTNTTEIKVEATNEKKCDELQLLKLSYAIILGIDVVYGVEALLFAIAVYFGAKLELMLLLEIAIAFHRATPLWVAPKMDESSFWRDEIWLNGKRT